MIFRSYKNDTLLNYSYYSNTESYCPPSRVKPSNYDEVCKQDKNCPAGCDVCCELPYHYQSGKEEVQK